MKIVKFLTNNLITDEVLASMIVNVHNLAFYTRLMREAREQIIAGTFREWKNKMVKQVSQRL
jgi:queuine tRNA-ribosyltransferase